MTEQVTVAFYRGGDDSCNEPLINQATMFLTGKFCHCEECQKLEGKYDNIGGPLYDYLLELSGFLKREHPGVVVKTLAYRKKQTEFPPKIDKLPDNIIIHFGNSSGGTIGSSTVLGEEKSLNRAAAIFDVLAPKYSDLTYTCHGGAIEYPPQFQAFLAKEPRFDGYVGGSSAERFPIEDSVPKTTQAFKAIRR